MQNNNTLDTAILIRNVNSQSFGGGETYQIKAARELQKNNIKPIIATNSKRLIELAKAEKIKTIIPPYIKNQNWSGAKNLLLPYYFLKLAQQSRWYYGIFKEINPTTVNIQSRDDWISATIAAHKLSINTIWTDHADFRNWVFQNIERPFKNIIGKTILKQASKVKKIILISNLEKNWIAKKLKKQTPKNITVVQNAVEDELDNYTRKRNFNSFAYLGRVCDEKGIPELLQAFEIVLRQHPNAELHIYGEGADYSRHKTKGIYFHGGTNDPIGKLSQSQFFIQSSRNEGLSLSLIEAAMMHMTIIATNVGATNEIIKHEQNGLLVSPSAPQELAEAIIRLLEDPKLALSYADNARRTYEDSYSLEKVFKKKLLPLYKGAK